MNILVFSWRDPKHPNAGGAEQVMHEHLKAWIRAGNNVTFFSSRVKGLADEESLDGVKIIRRGVQYLGVQLAGFFYYLANSGKFDLVVDQFHGLPFFTPLYVEGPKLAVIQEVAGRVWLKNDLPKPLSWIVGIIGYLGEPLLFLFYKNVRFMTGSKSTKNELTKVGIGLRMITIVPHGVKVIIPKPLPKKEKVPTVMYLGAITMDKGIDQALETFNILNKKGKFQFWMVGRASESYRNYLKLKIKEFGLSNLKFFGFVDDEKKFRLLAKAHVLLNPSILEGWGLVNIEANAVGLPVVAYRSPGLVDSVKDKVSGIICKENSPQDLAKEVIKIIEDRKGYLKLQKGAMSWSKNFTWDKSTKQSLKLIKLIK